MEGQNMDGCTDGLMDGRTYNGHIDDQSEGWMESRWIDKGINKLRN